MKTERQDLVKQFHETFGAPVAARPTHIPADRARLRVRLIAEELQEYARAAGLPVEILVIEEHEGAPAADLVEVADALGDLEYVVLGSAVEHGITLDPIVREIHRSNMTKDAATDAGGKIQKGPRYEPPELAGIVADQQAGKVEAPRSPAIAQALVAGFRGGWAAAMRSLAEELEQQELRARIAARGRGQVTLAAGPLAKMLLQRATRPPTPQTVAMKPGETPEQATARAERVGATGVVEEPAPPPDGFPTVQDALPILAGLLTIIAGGRAANERAARAEWVALCAFALACRRCAKTDGMLEELDREAAALDLLVLTPANGAKA
jgi:predicted HAD superfamily Cof-like phosphohydrolase